MNADCVLLSAVLRRDIRYINQLEWESDNTPDAILIEVRSQISYSRQAV